jgi:hypothetical protein
MQPSISLAVAAVAAELAGAGAEAVILFGSHARGDAHPHSDIDLLAVGDGPEYTLSRREGCLLSVSWLTADRIRAGFTRPWQVGWMVPGWQEATLIHDPAGVAAALQGMARTWTWEAVGEATCDRAVADEITGFAEEIHKLVGALTDGRDFMAAVQRNILAFRMGVIMALHLRLLYGTENVLWDRVAERMGPEWATDQARAFGLDGESLAESAAGALALYVRAARAADRLFTAEQRAVVAHACHLAEHPPEKG